jgi:D-glycero-D-manno-heptose 1,7-bisphosphate phosphatase
MKRAAFLDRDGVINRKATEGDYITRWEQLEILAGVPAALARLNQAGLLVVVVTNQRCVAKGLIDNEGVNLLHKKLLDRLAGQGAIVDAIYYCPHDVQPPCDCRKPSAGMLFNAARDHSIDLKLSWMIGDSLVDVQAGQRAGCRTALLTDEASTIDDSEADVTARDLAHAVAKILDHGTVNAWCNGQNLEG